VAKRTMTTLLGAALALLTAAPAEARLAYVKDGLRNRIFVAADDGSHAHRLGTGRSPTVSPDGRWVAWIAPGSPEQLKLRLADRSRKARVVIDSPSIGELHFSPDSKLLGMEVGTRLLVYDIHERSRFRAASGNVRGFSFSPDSNVVVYGNSGRNAADDARSDLFSRELDRRERNRITWDRRSLNPLWGPDGIIYDRQRLRPGDAPAYNLFAVNPDGGSVRRITSLNIPSLVSGLLPLEQSADGDRLLAEFVGQDTSVGFRVNPATGRVHALGTDFENGFVAADLTADGRTVLGHTGGPAPTERNNVVTMPYRGGEQTVLVRRAYDPDWSM
jgi:WD40 repeat protein